MHKVDSHEHYERAQALFPNAVPLLSFDFIFVVLFSNFLPISLLFPWVFLDFFWFSLSSILFLAISFNQFWFIILDVSLETLSLSFVKLALDFLSVFHFYISIIFLVSLFFPILIDYFSWFLRTTCDTGPSIAFPFYKASTSLHGAPRSSRYPE